MSTHMDNIRRMAELEAEHGAALEQVIYWRERAVGAEREHDALVAYVERIMACFKSTSAALPSAWQAEMYGLFAQSPTSSLARLKAEWQADELSAMIAALPFGESLARGMLKHRRDELRRRVEGGE